MAVNVVRFESEGKPQWGVVSSERIRPLSGDYPTTGDLIRNGLEEARSAAAAGGAGEPAEGIPLHQVRLLSPVTSNQQLVCQGVNYRTHMIESGIDPDRQPHNIIFRKASSALSPADADIVRPAHVRLLDYEIELGFIVARDITGPVRVTPENLADYVAALVIVNDVSARDVQLPQGQFYKGKSYRTFAPAGPWLTLVGPDELRRFDDLHLQLWVNDEPRQDVYAREMVFKPAATLTELSGVQDFYAGDLIATGTPGGVAVQAPRGAMAFLAKVMPDQAKWRAFVKRGSANPRYLKPGDCIRSVIRTDDGAVDLGAQHNRIIEAD